MNQVRPPAPQLANIEPYDPKYIPAEVMISANENPCDVPLEVRREVEHAVRKLPLNRYPDPLANDLRDLIAEANGLDRDQVIIGNGGDELLFNLALAWGGPGRTFLNFPPTFSVYRNNAQLTNTAVVDIPRKPDFTLDEDAIIERLSRGDIDYAIVCSPNNPSGNLAANEFVKRMCQASDALVMVDEAYFEFSRFTARPLLDQFENLVILRTFSKAFSLAGARLGYLLGSERVVNEFKKVRQPYSVDAVSQAAACVIYEHRAVFEKGIDQIIEERARLLVELGAMDGVEAFPSDSNYILFRLADRIDAGAVWQRLLDGGILIRDFSRSPGLEGCMRVSVGLPEENTRFLEGLNTCLEQLR